MLGLLLIMKMEVMNNTVLKPCVEIGREGGVAFSWELMMMMNMMMMMMIMMGDRKRRWRWRWRSLLVGVDDGRAATHLFTQTNIGCVLHGREILETIQRNTGNKEK